MRIRFHHFIVFTFIAGILNAQRVSTTIKAPLPVKVNAQATVMEAPDGAVMDTLKKITSLTVYETSGNWAHCIYGERNGWINMKYIPGFTLIAHNFIPGYNGGLIKVDANCTANPADRKIIYYQEHEQFSGKSLFTFSEFGLTENDTIPYWIFYTGNAEYPYMLLFGGHAGDMHHEVPIVSLFGAESILTWYPNAGNRMTSEFIGINNNMPVIREAYYCMIPINTQLKIDDGKIKRVKGVFDKKMYNKETSGDLILNAQIILYKTSDGNGIAGKGKVGWKYETLELLEADFTTDMIKIRLNGSLEGWLKKKEFITAFPAFYSIACCGCG